MRSFVVRNKEGLFVARAYLKSQEVYLTKLEQEACHYYEDIAKYIVKNLLQDFHIEESFLHRELVCV